MSLLKNKKRTRQRAVNNSVSWSWMSWTCLNDVSTVGNESKKWQNHFPKRERSVFWLCKAHISKDCRKWLSHNICGLNCPSTLHINQSKKEMAKEWAQIKHAAAASVQTSAAAEVTELHILKSTSKAKKGNATGHTSAICWPRKCCIILHSGAKKWA